MRIVLVSRDEPPVRCSDAGLCTLALARALAADGHGVHLITENAGAKRPTLGIEGRLRIHRLSVPGEGARHERRAGDFAVEAARTLARLARRGEIDAAEFADTDAAAAPWLLARAALPEANIPTITTLYSRADTPLTAATAALADALIAPTRARAARTRAEVLPSPVDRAPGAPSLRGGPSLLGGPPLRGGSFSSTRPILAIIRPDQPAETDLLARAWSAAAAWLRGCTLHVIAAPSDTPVGAAALRLAVERSLTFDARPSLASVSVAAGPDALHAAAAGASACVVPSSISSFCCTAAAAMAAGRPVIADGEPASFSFRRGDAGDLAARFAEMALMPGSALAAAGASAAERMRTAYDPAAAARARLGLYRRLSGAGASIHTSKHRLAAWRTLRGLAEATA